MYYGISIWLIVMISFSAFVFEIYLCELLTLKFSYCDSLWLLYYGIIQYYMPVIIRFIGLFCKINE